MKKEDEIRQSILHVVGVALAIAGIVLLNDFCVNYENIRQIISFSVFGVSMVLFYLNILAH